MLVGAHSYLTLCDPMDCVWPTTLLCPWNFPGKDTGVWSGLPFPTLGNLPDPGMKPRSPAWQTDSLPLAIWEALDGS